MRSTIRTVSLLLMLALLVPGIYLQSDGEDRIEFEEGEWSPPSIEMFDLTVENDSGTFVFEMDVEGSAPNGTEDLKLTLGLMNGTVLEMPVDFWVEEGSLMLLQNGYEFESTGDGMEPWSSWSFHAGLRVPMDVDLEFIMGLLETITGEEIDGAGLLDNGSIPELDMGDALETLSETRIFVIARCFNSTGSWGQSYLEVTDEVMLEVVSFAAGEGITQGDDDDDDDTGSEPEEEDTSDKDRGMLLAAVGGASVVFLAAVIITFVLILRISKKE